METNGRENELKKLALAYCTNPGRTASELAKEAGISRATFYRVYQSKDHLSHLLSEKAKDAFLSSVGMMKEEEDPKAVLCRMIDRCYENKEYIMVLCFGRNGADCHMEDKEIYEKGMNDFFLKGQKEGIFRVDIPATAMTQLFAGTMIALFEGEWEGKIASANLAAYWKNFFLDGILSDKEREENN